MFHFILKLTITYHTIVKCQVRRLKKYKFLHLFSITCFDHFKIIVFFFSFILF